MVAGVVFGWIVVFEEVVVMIVFFVFVDVSYVIGVMLMVDGGFMVCCVG